MLTSYSNERLIEGAAAGGYHMFAIVGQCGWFLISFAAPADVPNDQCLKRRPPNLAAATSAAGPSERRSNASFMVACSDRHDRLRRLQAIANMSFDSC